MTWRVVGLIASASAVVAVLVGCSTTSSGDPGGSSARSASIVASPTAASSPTDSLTLTAAATAQEKALAAYRGMWSDMAAAATTSDYRSPLLGRHAGGDALLKIKQSLHADKRAGLVTKGQPTLDPRVQAVSPNGGLTRISVADCSDDSHWLKYKVLAATLGEADAAAAG